MRNPCVHTAAAVLPGTGGIPSAIDDRAVAMLTVTEVGVRGESATIDLDGVADGRWLRTDAVVVDQEHGSTIRWFAEGAFHQRRLGDDERAHVMRPDEEPAFYRQREPDRLRLHEPPQGRRIIRILGFVLLAIAAIAGVLGFVLMLLA